MDDDCIYSSDFGEELFDVVSVEEFLQASQESNDFASCSTVRETYFHISDYEEEIQDDEEHSGHQPGTDTNKLYLSVHPINVSLAMKILSTVPLASKNKERKNHEHGWRIGTSHFSILPYYK